MKNNLNIKNTKEYLKMVFDLESTLYQNQQMKENYIKHRKKNEPVEPIKETFEPPIEPKIDSEDYTLCDYWVFERKQGIQIFHIMLFLCIAASGIFMSIFSLKMIVEIFQDIFGGWYGSNNISGSILWIILTLCFDAGAIFSWKKIKQDYEQQKTIYNEENNKKHEEYNKKLSEFRTAEQKALETYNLNYIRYIEDKAKWDNETDEHIRKFEDVHTCLSHSLNSCYSKDVIYTKYRNLVAVATIYEYFESGRCTELEGPDGAYNLYESELRSNIIINSLNIIISDLNQIKNGQYALYEMINTSNVMICDMLNNINKAQYLTAYFAKQAALAASADRYIVGRVYN